MHELKVWQGLHIKNERMNKFYYTKKMKQTKNRAEENFKGEREKKIESYDF